MIKKIFILAITAFILVSCQESLEERAAREAREVTEAKCPMPVGNNMYLDSIVFDIPSLTQTQYFRFIGDTDNDSMVIAMRDADLKGALIQELKNTPTYKTLMKRGANFRYVYRSTKDRKKTYFDFIITKADYAQSK